MVDIAKGIGILLIVLGHNPHFARNFQPFAELLAAFRLPFFFFISGTLFSVGKKTLSEVAVERADAWLKPVAVVTLVAGFIGIMLGRSTIEATVLSIVYATGFTLMWPALWFLPHLWLLYVFSTWLLRTFKSIGERRWIATLLVIAMISINHLILQHFDGPMDNPACRNISTFGTTLLSCGLPFSADLIFMTAGFFLMGYFMSAETKTFQINGRLLLVALTLMSFFQWFFDANVNLNYRRYDDLFICTAQAICGIYIMLCLCKVLTRSSLATAVLSYCGRASLFILLFHTPILGQINHTLPRFISSPALVGIAAFVLPILLSIIFWNICKRVGLLSLLLLPAKSVRATRPAGMDNSSPTAA